MAYVYKRRRPPSSWRTYRKKAYHEYLIPVMAIEWAAEWTAYVLSQSSMLEVLEYLGSLSIVVGVIFYFADSKSRLEQKHYQAWQVINTAHGKGGSGGRIDALQELNADRVPLVGVDVSDAFLQGLNLRGADLHRCNMSSADVRSATLSGSSLESSAMVFANLRGGRFERHASGARRLHGFGFEWIKVAQCGCIGREIRSGRFARGGPYRTVELEKDSVHLRRQYPGR